MNNQLNPTNEELLKNLELIINQTYKAEADFNELNQIFRGVINALPSALWVVSNNQIYLFNEKAKEIPLKWQEITVDHNDTEIEIDDRFYILQVSKEGEKTIILATDNTKSRRNERLIAMGQMAAHLAHEIRNPVGAVSIMASTLFNRVDLGSKALVLEIKKSIWRVERIVKATLLFSKGFTINPSAVTLSDLATELESAVGNYSYSKEIAFNFLLPNSPATIDYDLISLVLQNMVFNAIDAIEESENDDGKVEIEYRFDNGLHQIDISDSGKDFEDRDGLFQAFFTTKTKGHGLGLVLSRQIIEAHGGTISLLDTKKGFAITIKNMD